MPTRVGESIPFLKLPVEIRVIIYTHVLNQPRCIVTFPVLASTRRYTSTTYDTHLPDYTYHAHPALPAIALASKEIREEVLGVYYSVNEFVIGAHFTDGAFCWTVNTWRQYLGRHAQDLRSVALITAMKGGTGLLEMQAVFKDDGRITIRPSRWSITICACDMYRTTQHLQQSGKKDGRLLLSALEDLAEGAYYEDEQDMATECAKCGRPQLQRANVEGWQHRTITYKTTSGRGFSDLDDEFGLNALRHSTLLWEWDDPLSD